MTCLSYLSLSDETERIQTLRRLLGLLDPVSTIKSCFLIICSLILLFLEKNTSDMVTSLASKTVLLSHHWVFSGILLGVSLSLLLFDVLLVFCFSYRSQMNFELY